MILILFLIGTRWCTTSFEINKLQHQGYVLASYCFLKEIGKNHINKCKDPLRILIIFPLNSHSKEHQAEVACSVFLISQRMIRKWISFWMCKCEKIVTFSSLLSKRCNFVAVGDYWLVERFRLSVVNTKPELSQDPIRRWENNCKNRWKLEVNSKRSKARENAGDQVVIGFGFAPDWLREWRKFFWTNHRAEKSKTNATRSIFDTQL